MDADAEPHRLADGAVLVLCCDRRLDRDGALDRVDGAGEIGDHAVPGGVEDPATVRSNQAIDDHPASLEPTPRADLVQLHQAAVLGNVGGKDHRQLSFDYLAFRHRPS